MPTNAKHHQELRRLNSFFVRPLNKRGAAFFYLDLQLGTAALSEANGLATSALVEASNFFELELELKAGGHRQL